MKDSPLQEENVYLRLRLLILSRIAIATFVLGFTTFIDIAEAEAPLIITITWIHIIILTTYALTFVYIILFKFINSIKINIYIQNICDVVIITSFIFVTGGVTSIYSVFYPVVIIYSVLFLEKKGGVIIATVCSISYALLLNLEYYRVIYPIYDISHGYALSAGYVFTRIFIHILSFYIIAFLASFVVEKEKHARMLLAEKETEFDQLDLLHRSIIESVDTGIMTINPRGKIKSFNRAAEDITGYSFNEIENRNLIEIFPGFKEMLEEAAAKDYSKSVKNRSEVVLKAKGGKNLILGCSLSTLKDVDGKRFGDILVFQDISSMKDLERDLEKSRRLAFIGEMAAALAHEMRNPLASIVGSIQVLKRDLLLNQADERLMQIIMRGKEQLESFMKDFLLLAKPIQGVREKINPNDIIKDMIESIQYLPDWNDNIEISLSLSENTFIIANATEIREIVVNLILNAIQAMPEGGILKIETENLFKNNAENVFELRISDTGYGIEENLFEKVLEPFFTTKEKGTGLGLAIVNRIVETYSGNIKIISKHNNGTTIVVSLPVIH